MFEKILECLRFALGHIFNLCLIGALSYGFYLWATNDESVLRFAYFAICGLWALLFVIYVYAVIKDIIEYTYVLSEHNMSKGV